MQKIKDFLDTCLMVTRGGDSLNVREAIEKREKETLSKYAALSCQSRGRRNKQVPCDIRTEFQRDRDRILHSKAFRRLKHKTQVFLSPEGDHYRTRLTHTLEVAQISRTIARALFLNEDLTEAIALGHDLGHTPFGHCGEAELNDIHRGGFKHNIQSLRVVDVLEKKQKSEFGLNLTEEVRDGILHHSGPGLPYTLEGQIVKLCDRIAYINHDIDDAIRAQVLKTSDIPSDYIDVLGDTHSKRINTMILDVIESSRNSDYITMNEERLKYFNALRKFMFDKVYLNEAAKGEEAKARKVLRSLYYYFAEHPDEMPKERFMDFEVNKLEAVKDYVAGMSDRYAVKVYQEKFIPHFWV